MFRREDDLSIVEVYDPPLTSASVTSAASGSVWLDSDTGTVTVDPTHTNDLHTARWIGTGNDHLQHLDDRRNHDEVVRAFNNSKNWWVGYGLPWSEPRKVTHSQLSAMSKFASPYTSKCDNEKGWRGIDRAASDGSLPSHLQMIWNNSFPDKGRGEIEAEMREVDRRSANRVFDRTGPAVR
jgi:hypothetical protein